MAFKMREVILPGKPRQEVEQVWVLEIGFCDCTYIQSRHKDPSHKEILDSFSRLTEKELEENLLPKPKDRAFLRQQLLRMLLALEE